jgi:hypothetical protein
LPQRYEKSIYTKSEYLPVSSSACGIYYVLERSLPPQLQLTNAEDGMFASLGAMSVVAAPKISLPSYENPNRGGSSGVKPWKAKNRVR